MDKVKVFANELEHIKTISAYNFAVEAINKLPEYFFDTAASSTGKYHPRYALGFGGLVRHTKAAAKMAIQMLELEHYKEVFSEEERDLMIVALILHDGWKHGIHYSKYTVATHPIIMADFIRGDADLRKHLTQEQLDFVTGCVASHMGEWTTDYRTKKEILPKPVTEAQKFVHLCDWLASRKWLNVDFEDDIYDEATCAAAENELNSTIDEIIAKCKQAVADGMEKTKLYEAITGVIGCNNPKKIKTLYEAERVMGAVNARIALHKLNNEKSC